MSFEGFKGTPEQRHQFIETYGLDEDGNPPELHSDLAACVYEDEDGYTHLKHPLYFQLHYEPMLAGIANRAYVAKQAALEEYRAEQNWDSILFLHERAYRIQAFLEIQSELSDQEYWETLNWLWTDTENLWQNVDVWRFLLKNPKRPGRRKWFMDDEERAKLASLKTPIAVYRGTCSPDDMGAGLSWTLDRDRAEWFARRFSHLGLPQLITGTVKKSKVIAYLKGRNEEEIIAFWEDVDVIDYEIFELEEETTTLQRG